LFYLYYRFSERDNGYLQPYTEEIMKQIKEFLLVSDFAENKEEVCEKYIVILKGSVAKFEKI
ncbi:hypothetical protein, partial [Bacillus mycoides]|uniref:hypothetical protein n=1 Tax=Bacillus mycoides TaxID=1405 RepID=UPI0013658D88